MTIVLACLFQEFGKVDLAAAPLRLLDGRLTLRLPEGAKIEPRGHSLMGAPEPADRETRVVWSVDERKVVMMAYELFASVSGDFEAQVRKEVASWKMPKEREFSVAALKRDDASPRVCALTPPQLDLKQEVVLVLALYVGSRDGTVQYIAFYVNPKAGADAAGCAALASKVAMTVAAGDRKIAREAGPRVMGELGGGKCCVLDAPEGFVLTVQKGPDFTVSTLRKVVPLGEEPPSVGLYVGGHPNHHHRRAEGGPEVGKSAGKLLGCDVEWHRWTGKGQDRNHFLEAIFAPPAAGSQQLHLFLQAASEPALKELETLAGKLRLEEKK